MPAHTQIRYANETFLAQMTNGSGMEKTALDGVQDFTRTTLREEGFWDKLIPEVSVTNDDLTRRIETDTPFIVVDKEPGSRAAVTVPFGKLPSNLYIQGPRYGVSFDRIVTPRFVKDVEELRTWIMDIRQVFSDNAVKDMMAEKDAKGVRAMNLALLGPDVPMPHNGNIAQWVTIPGGISRETITEALNQVMPKGPSRLSVTTFVLNMITVAEFLKWFRDETGGDWSEDMMKNGWTSNRVQGKEMLVTIKRELIPDDSVFLFSSPDHIGKNFALESPTMYVKKEAYMIEFFLYTSCGGAFGHVGGLGRVDFV